MARRTVVVSTDYASSTFISTRPLHSAASAFWSLLELQASRLTDRPRLVPPRNALSIESAISDKEKTMLKSDTSDDVLIRARSVVEKRHRRSTEALERATPDVRRSEAEERYFALFNAIDQGFCTLDVAFDEHDNPVDYRFVTGLKSTDVWP